MIRTFLYTALLFCCLTSFAFGQIPSAEELINQNSRTLEVIADDRTTEIIRLNQELVELKTPQSEVEDAIVFLSKIPEEERIFIRFFTTYAIPKEKREDRILTLSFIIHSLVGPSTTENSYLGGVYPLAIRDEDGFKPYQRVPDSETLWWIDLRNYNWTPQAWEAISLDDGYFAEPIVSHDRSGILRLLSGNAIVRADWFIVHVMDTTRQQDMDIQDDFYFTLLYANSEKPKNIEEWRASWGADIKRAAKIGNQYGTLVTQSKAVGKYNRMLFGYRTELGYLYESYDVKNQRGKRDYVESYFLNKDIGGPPEVSDAGELFASNYLGLQVYALHENGKLINFGDPTVVRHINDVVGDVRVRNPHSCIDCHAEGPLPAENTMRSFMSDNTDVYAYDKKDAIRIKRTMLDSRFEESVLENQQFFEKALKKVNGLAGKENGALYLSAIKDYEKSVDLKTAAFECGVTEEEFITTIRESKYRFGNRLKILVQTGDPIPRDVWDSPGRDGIPGAFQQAMIMINGVTVIEEEQFVEETVKLFEVIEPKGAKIMAGSEQVGSAKHGDILIFTGDIVNGWAWIYTQKGLSGYVHTKYLQYVEVPLDEALEIFEDAGEKALNKLRQE